MKRFSSVTIKDLKNLAQGIWGFKKTWGNFLTSAPFLTIMTGDGKGFLDMNLFQTPMFLGITVGIPFCIFKLLLGILMIRVSGPGPLGYMVILWAAVDLGMNLARMAYHLLHRPSTLEFCIIAQAGRIIQRPKLFLAVDTTLSFSIVCFFLWSGWITLLTTVESSLWYLGTTLNLLGIAMVNLWTEFSRGG